MKGKSEVQIQPSACRPCLRLSTSKRDGKMKVYSFTQCEQKSGVKWKEYLKAPCF